MGRDKQAAAQEQEQEEGKQPSERPYQSFGSMPWEPGKSRVEPETLAYLTEVAGHVNSVEDGEEMDLLLTNVLEELSGKELRVAADAAGDGGSGKRGSAANTLPLIFRS